MRSLGHKSQALTPKNEYTLGTETTLAEINCFVLILASKYREKIAKNQRIELFQKIQLIQILTFTTNFSPLTTYFSPVQTSVIH